MNNRSIWGALAIAALVIAVAATIGIGAYNAGMAQGIAESGRAVAAPPAGTPYVYMWPRPWGFHFFPFFPFFPFFGLLFLFFVLRGFFWRGPWRGGRGCGYGGYDDAPPMFDEWHRRAHAQEPPAPPTEQPTRNG